MTPFEAYKKYVALKLHFKSENYDYFKFSGQFNASKDSFDRRKDRHFFQRLSKIYTEKNFEHLLIANLLDDPDTWIGAIMSDVGRNKLHEWKKINQALEYTFSQDIIFLKTLIEENKIKNFDDLFSTNLKDQNWPPIVTLVMQKQISIETFVIMNKILGFIPRFDRTTHDQIVWPQFKNKCVKYAPFLDVSIKKYRKLMRDTFLINSDKKNVDNLNQI
mgnify:CR=1 FL=1